MKIARRNFQLSTVAIVFAEVLLFAPPDALSQQSGKPASAIVFLQAEQTQINPRQTVLRSAVGVTISPEGHILASSDIFGDRRSVSQVLGLVVRRASIGESAVTEELDILSIDESRGIAILRAKKEGSAREFIETSEADPSPFQRVTLLTVDLDIDGKAKRVSSVEGYIEDRLRRVGLLGDVSLKIAKSAERVLNGSPVVSQEGKLLGIVSGTLSGEIGVISIASIRSALDLVRPSMISTAITETRTVLVPIEARLVKHVAGESIERFTQTFRAPPGFKIVSTNLLVSSANGIALAPYVKVLDERTATVTVALRSGPVWDQRRGWFTGKLQVELVPE